MFTIVIILFDHTAARLKISTPADAAFALN